MESMVESGGVESSRAAVERDLPRESMVEGHLGVTSGSSRLRVDGRIGVESRQAMQSIRPSKSR